jgi:hypothetical protein
MLILLPQCACAAPPTLDPTYGEPLPRLAPPSSSPALAQWIWTDHTAGSQTVCFRGSLTLKAVPKTALLFASGDDAFTAYVNGVTVDSSVAVEQGWKHVHTADIATVLHAGRNVIAIQGTNSGGAAGVIALLQANGHTVMQTGRSWKCRGTSSPNNDWTKPAYDDRTWAYANEEAPVGEGPWRNELDNWPGQATSAWYLAHKTIEPQRLTVLAGQVAGVPMGAPRAPLRIVAHPSAAGSPPPQLMVDFGQELAGRIEVAGSAGSTVIITTGESREECFHAEPLLDNRGPHAFTLFSGNLSATPYSAFRYALLTFPDTARTTVTRVDCDHKYYPVSYKGSFASSDPLLAKIWYTGAYTAHLCMQEDIWDAPKRDRGLWCGDLQVTGESINNAFADTFLMEKSIAGLRIRAQGAQPDTDLPANEINSLPGYTAAWFCEMADFYRHVGDDSFLKSEHQNILTLLAFQQSDFDVNHLFVNPRKAWNFVDWSGGFIRDSDASHMAVDLYDIQGIHEAVFLLRALGDTASAEKYEAWANTLTVAARTAYLDPADQTFGSRLQTNLMAVFSHVARPKETDAIYSKILRFNSPAWQPMPPTPGVGPSDLYAITPYFAYFALRDYGDLGKRQDAIDLIRKYWGGMLGRGATTFWEKYDPTMPNDFRKVLDMMPYISLSHGWSSGPTSFLSEYVLGVRPTSGGMKTIVVDPFLGDTNWAEGNVPAPQGIVHVRAEKVPGGELVTLRLPHGISAQVGLPASRVTLNGVRAKIIRSERGISYIQISKGGSYQIRGIVSSSNPSRPVTKKP